MDEKNIIKKIDFFKKRIIGLTSYFSSAEKLLPKYDPNTNYHIIEIPMSDYQFQLYEKIRVEERKLEKSNRGKTDDKKTSTYRIFSRAFCNFVFPPEIKRPTPIKGQSLEETVDQVLNEDLLDGANANTVINNIDGQHTLDEMDQIKKDIQENTDNLIMMR